MLQLTPQVIRIVEFYEDGEQARHFTFEPLGFVHDGMINVGQYFMLTVPGVGQAPFTYTSLPDTKGRFVALIRNVGKLTDALFKLRPGSLLGYNGPLGRGWPVEEIADKEVLIVAGGCGLAPVSAVINQLIDSGQAGETTVLYGARDKASQVLHKERNYWQKKVLMYETLMVGEDQCLQGTPSEHISRLLTLHNKQPRRVLTCGPDAMMRAVANTCIALGISSHQIWLSLERRMHCGIGLCGHCYLAHSYVCKQGPTYRYDELQALENKTTQFPAHGKATKYC
jgi:anaerobic sulfite reductase subunit B